MAEKLQSPPRALCSVTLESAEFAFDPAEGRLAEELALRALVRTPYFLQGLAWEAFGTITRNVERALEGLRERGGAGFTLCPLRTEGITMTREEVEVRFSGAIVTFVPAGSDVSEQGEGYRRLCRTYYRRILAAYVERNLPRRLAREGAADAGDGSARAGAALRDCLEELARTLPLPPYRDRYEAVLSSTGDARAALGWTRQAMLEEATRRLGL